MGYQTYLKNPSSLVSYSLVPSHAVYYRYRELIRYIYNTKKKNKEEKIKGLILKSSQVKFTMLL